MAVNTALEKFTLSEYAKGLVEHPRRRYEEKLGLISFFDPFLLPSMGGTSVAAPVSLPPVEASDIVAYLVLQTSFLTTKQFKAHKSLDAYNQFINGWVKDVEAWSLAGKIVVTGRVRHSQRYNDTPLSCWIICHDSGEVCCAHCNCMAGLGEVCTHIGAVLFYLEASTKISNEVTCTQQKCKWIIPGYQRDIPYLPVKNLDFTSAKAKQKMIEIKTSKETRVFTKAPDSSELNNFFEKLNKSGTKPGILSFVDPYSDNYVPKAVQPSFSKPLQIFFDEKYLNYSYTKLLDACVEIDISITQENVTAVEMETKGQSKSNLWFTYRAGRITASRMKSACHTDPSHPSQSLIKAIAYPEAYKFISKATSWGCQHEKHAREFYSEQMMRGHCGFAVHECGLFLNPKWPYLGASPDGVVTCSCCSKGVVEIKCPFCHRNDAIVESSDDKQFCLKKDSNNCLQLDHLHAYYYQVQTQIFVCEVDYCDVVVCTFPEDQSKPDIHIERIFPNESFWSERIEQSSHFFKICILPEILGRWYSRPHIQRENKPNTTEVPSSSEHSSQPLYCYCRQPESREQTWIACDNPGCHIEWYHTDCLKLKSIPKDNWYCPTCRVLPEFKRKRGTKRPRKT